MPDQTAFVSYAPDREDVVLWRGLRGVADGRYVDLVGGTDAGSLTRGLHERGWSGVLVAADPAQADLLRDQRADDAVVAAVADVGPQSCHVLVAERADTATVVDLAVRLAPWVVVVRTHADEAATALAGSGYVTTLDTGPSRILVRAEHEDLAALLRLPANSQDDFVDSTTTELRSSVDELTRELERWRGLALSAWATWQPRHSSEWTIHDERERDSLRAQLAAIQQTLSWRVTRPLRALRGVVSR